jgi:transcription elongation GreA/GreB family factor
VVERRRVERQVNRPSNAREERQRRERQQALETQIASLEDQLAALGRLLERPPADAGEVQRMGQEYVQLQHQLDACYEEWAGLSETES